MSTSICTLTESAHRRKRASEESEDDLKINYFDEEGLNHGITDPQDSLQNNQSYDYDYEKFKNEYYHRDSEQIIDQTLNEEYSGTDESLENINLHKTKRITAKSNVPMENYCSAVLLFRTRVRNK